MNAFAAAIEILFADPNIGVEAIYTSDGGAPMLVRVVARRADAVSEFGDARLWSERVDAVRPWAAARRGGRSRA